MKRHQDRWLVLPDLQLPFEHVEALRFAKAVQREFHIPASNILNVGDEADQYHGTLYPKDPDALLTARQELKITRDKVRIWGNAFPEMRLAVSNHGLRWVKKAAAADIPSELLRCYRELIGAPEGWKWKEQWIIKGRHPFLMFHGMGYSGAGAYRLAPVDKGISTVFGHLHANAGIAKIETAEKSLWGMNVGCLIDNDAFAFKYGKHNRHKPWLGCGVIIDGGLTPLLLPLERF
jgi:hypothetical protein